MRRTRRRGLGGGASPAARNDECGRDHERQATPGARDRAQRPYETLSAFSLFHSNASVGKTPSHSIDSPNAISFVLVALSVEALNVAVSVVLLIKPPADPVTLTK